MNKIYKVLWNETKQAYVVVSELAKNQGKKSGKAIAVMALAALFTTGMTGGVARAADNAAGSGNGVAIGTGSTAPKAENVVVGKGATIKYSNGASNATGDVAIGSGAVIDNYVSQGGSIAIGKNAQIANMAGQQENLFSLGQTVWTEGFTEFWGIKIPNGVYTPADPSKALSSIAIGDNTYARTGSIMIGPHNYKGKLGDTEVDTAKTSAQSVDVLATTIGANSFTDGAFGTNMGAYNIVSGSYSGGRRDIYKASQNFGATITGSLNSIESASSNSAYSGIANSIVGVANRTNNSNGSLIFGAGNVITNSLTTLDGTQTAASSAKEFQTNLIDSVKAAEGGGAAMAIGGSNTIDYARKSQVMGVGNTLKGESGNVSQYNFIDGYKNTAEKVTNVSVLDSNNTVSGTTAAQVIGDNRTISAANNSVVIGSADSVKSTEKAGVTVIGHNANATEEGAVAIGENSVASTKAGIAGYDPTTKLQSTETSSTWVATNAAVSVGDGTTVTRQITGVAAGWADTDAVNVAQLKKVAANAASSAVDAGKYSSVVAGDNITVTKNAGANAAKGDEYKVALNDKVRVADYIGVTNGPVMSKTGIDAAGNKITNVAAGSADTDAVNVSQLKGVDNRVTNNTNAINNINQNVENMGHRINNLDSRINKVGAGAAALAALHPQDFNSDDKWDFAAGFGNYRDANAVALGAFYRPDHKTMFSVGSSFGNGENMVNVGVSLKFGKNSPYTGMSKAALVSQLESQNKEISDLKAQNEAQNGRIEKLEQLVQQLLGK